LSSAPDIVSRLARIRESIADACDRAGRRPEEILLIGASKRVEAERILEAVRAGLPALGENYVQEAVSKIEEIGRPAPWHFIGHLQRNKAKVAAMHFDLVQTVDSLALAQALDRHAEALGKTLPILLEVNLAGDPERPGVPPEEVERMADAANSLKNIRLQGLMGMPPPVISKEDARPFFRTLKRLWDALHNENRMALSMGMTSDFPVAIEEGSTMIRVGTGIFGPRPPI
jgi:pyridoxal phosphate enzyme (YggS family)